VARRRERLEELARELRERCSVEVRVLPADLSDPAAPAELHAALGEAGIAVDALVNNAGYAIARHFTKGPWKEQSDLIQVLVTAPVHLCRLFVPAMVARGEGWVLNVGSIAAWAPPSPGSLYGASKSFNVLFSRALGLELAGSGVNVTSLCPGFTRSDFHDVMGTREAMDRVSSLMWMDARRVAEQGYDALMAGKPVLVNGLLNRLIVLLCILVPDALVNALRPAQTREGL